MVYYPAFGRFANMNATPLWEQQTEKNLAGGINWFLPDDRVASPEAIDAQNFRTNQAGSLRSRRAEQLLYGGSGVNSIYRILSAASPRRIASNTSGSLFDLNGGSIASGMGGAPAFMVFWKGYLWATTRSAQVKFKVGDDIGFAWTIPAPTSLTLVRVAAGSLKIGVIYTYWVTYQTADGQESSPFNATFTPDATGQAVSIRVDDPGVDPQLTAGGWNLYRSGDTLNTAYRMNVALTQWSATVIDFGSDGAGTMFSDISLLRLGIALVVDRSGPPAAAGLAGPFFDHLLAWSTVEHPNRLYWSTANQPSSFPGSGALSATGNWVDCGDDGDPILNVTVRPRFALIYKQNQIYRLVGDPDSFTGEIERVMDGFGLAAVKAITSVGALDVLLGPDGIYQFNGDFQTKISPQVEPIFLGQRPDLNPALLSAISEMNLGAVGKCCMAYRNGRIHFSYPAGASSENSATLEYDVHGQRWYRDNRGFSALYDEGQVGNLLGAAGGGVYDVEGSAGAAMAVIYQSQFHDQGLPESQKTYTDLVIDANTGGAALTVSVWYDHGSSTEILAGPSLSTASRRQVAFPISSDKAGGDKLGARAQNISVRIEGNTTASSVYLYGWTLHYRIEARDALVWDTGPAGLSIPYAGHMEANEIEHRVKQLDLLEFEIESTDVVNLTVYSDLPGQSMASRFTFAMPATNGRQSVEVPILNMVMGSAFPVEGRLIRVTLVSNTFLTTFKLYAARARVRPIGFYFDGSNLGAGVGEQWMSPLLSLH